ncbi:MAG: 23S rRNA (pseudouridine(1915)-N(3))-methyltransferase RlmH [Lachnospiraceae bacterium]|jgi:23S rRNA (pseudouridine1915-N3)-methyltransferase
MKVTILCVGKIKEKFFREACAEYAKRLSRFCTFDITEVADENTPQNASSVEEKAIKNREGKRLLAHVRPDDYIVALAIGGKSWDSVRYSEHLSDLMLHGKSAVTFVIGGSLGLSEEVLNRADEKLSFSAFTFPHQLMRVILAEQIYRWFKIMNHEPYHK